MADFNNDYWSQFPTHGPGAPGYMPAPVANDPRLTTQPMPSQQGPGGRQGSVEHMPEVYNDPAFDAYYQQQKAAGKSFTDIMDGWNVYTGQPTGGNFGAIYNGNMPNGPTGPLQGGGAQGDYQSEFMQAAQELGISPQQFR